MTDPGPPARRVVAYVPDLMDRSKLLAVVPGARIVRAPAELGPLDTAATVVVDLSRPGALDLVDTAVTAGARVLAFGSHVDRVLLDAAAARGAQVLARSAFFSRLGELLG